VIVGSLGISFGDRHNPIDDVRSVFAAEISEIQRRLNP
jgi:hypothetical protein